MDERQFQIMIEKMDSIIRLLAMGLVEGKTLREQVNLLSSFGFQPKQIADILGKTLNHIRVLLHEIRKSRAQAEEKESKVSEVSNLMDRRSSEEA